MAGNGKSLLFLLRRCVAVSKVTLPTGVTTGGGRGVLLSRCGFVQQRAWTSSSSATVGLQRLCQLQSAVKTNQYSFCTKAEAPCDEEYPPLPAYRSDSEPEKKEVHIVHVKGLLWSCSAQDLLQFFSECRIRDGTNGIHLTLNKFGRPSGEAFIEMEYEDDVTKALEKHHQYLGPRYVEVYEVMDSDADVILKKVAQMPGDDGVVLLRGLPFSSTEEDIVQFFSGFDIVQKGITIVRDRRGRNSGEAYVQFSSQEAAVKALQRDREVIGNRYIEVFPSRREDIRSSREKSTSAPPQTGYQSANRRTASRTNPRSGSPHSSTVPLHYIHMRGLPFEVSAEDVVRFFSPLVVSKILIEFGPNGRPSGEADVYFHNHQDAMAAMSRDRAHIGARYIELFLNSIPECDNADLH